MTTQPSSASQEKHQIGVDDWLPGKSEATLWNVVAIVVVLASIPVFSLPSMIRSGAWGGSFQIRLDDVLVIVVLTAVLVVVHEAIHALVMRVFGAHPSFGALLVGGVMPALYATARGHRFSRGRYLAVAVTPAVVISVLGFVACFSPWGGYLIVPLAIHLGGCVGDGFATWKVLREPPGTEFEDLRDGIRFYRKPRG